MNIKGDGEATIGQTDTLFKNHSKFAYRFPVQTWRDSVRNILQKINQRFAFQNGFADVLMVTGELAPYSSNNRNNHVWEGYEFIAKQIDSLRYATGSKIRSLFQTGWLDSDSSAAVDFSGMLENVPDMDIFAMQDYVFDSTDAAGDQNTIQKFADAMRDAATRLKRKYEKTGKRTEFRPIIQTQRGIINWKSNGILKGRSFRNPTAEELLVQVNLGLANGAQGIIYYNYHSHEGWFKITKTDSVFNYESGLVDYQSEDTTAQYSNVRVINKNYLSKYGAKFLPLEWQRSFSILQEPVPISLESELYDVSTGDSHSQTYVEVGHFTGTPADYKDYYMVVNRRTDAARNITLTFQKKAGISYRVTDEFSGVSEFRHSDQNGRFSYTVSLDRAEGVLISVQAWDNEKEELLVNSDDNGNAFGWDRFEMTDINLGFSPAFTWEVTSGDPEIHNMISGDFDGDGYAEVVVSTEADWILSWKTKDGQQVDFDAIQPTEIYGSNTGFNILNIAAGDFDGDGRDELAINYDTTPNNIYNGDKFKIFDYHDGHFVEQSTYKWSDDFAGVAPDMQQLTVGDFNGDNRDDIGLRTEAEYVGAIAYNGLSWHFILSMGPSAIDDCSSCTDSIQNIIAGDFDGSDASDELLVSYKRTRIDTNPPHVEGDKIKILNYQTGQVWNWPVLNNTIDISPGNNPEMQFLLKGNYDDDPQDEFLTMTFWGWIHVFELYSGDNSLRQVPNTVGIYNLETGEERIKAITTADFDGDGKQEIAYAYGDSKKSEPVELKVRRITDGNKVKYRLYGSPIMSILGSNYEKDEVYAPVSLPKASADNGDISSPTRFMIRQNYPNPFNPETTIRYTLSETEQVTIKIYNMLGELVKTLVNERKTAGDYSIVWDGKNERGIPVVSGLYVYQLKAGEFTQTRKMIFLK